MPANVARRFGISQGLLHGWCKQDLPPLDLAEARAEISRSDLARARTRERIAEEIYDTVLDFFTTLRDQLQAASREDWLQKQDAAQLASLVGSEIDGVVRLLAGFRPSEQRDDDTLDAAARATDDAG